MKTMMRCFFCTVLLYLSLPSTTAQMLEQQLLTERSAILARDARLSGDAGRGAIVFHQPSMACARCHKHAGSVRESGLGPALTIWQERPDDEDLVDAVLDPSKKIRKGYESVQVVTSDGRIVSGLVEFDSADQLTLREGPSGRQIAIRTAAIEERRLDMTSIMPAGLVNQLTSRQQFLDLMRYLFEIRDGGVRRARELQPPLAMFALRIPEYEQHVDHKGLIRDLDDRALQRGEEIYSRLCINCHGDHEKPGSLPVALRFAQGRFRNGSDPWSLYRTLTHGFGFMAPQTWMVPQQKYDVIHFIRETYIRNRNPRQYFAITPEYLTNLPAGDTRGPVPQPASLAPWLTMDYGPRLTNTYEIGSDGSNFAYKGIAVRLDSGPGGISRGSAWMIFDHDTMRMAAAWTAENNQPEDRFIDWKGIHFDHQHGVHPQIMGDVHVSGASGPGWANPNDGSFEDNDRVLGRDGRHYGPLPQAWARYQGLTALGEQTLIHYTVGSASVTELPGMIVSPGSIGAAEPTVFTRSFNIGPRERKLTLLIGTLTRGAKLEEVGDQAIRCTGPEGCEDAGPLVAGLSAKPEGAHWSLIDDRVCLTLSAGHEKLRFILWFARGDSPHSDIPDPFFDDPTPDLNSRNSGPRIWPQSVMSPVHLGDESQAFAVDTLMLPKDNPWLARTRLTGLDFFSDDPDRMAVCSWDGDVWVVSGLTDLESSQVLSWKRIASGLFQPLGLKIMEGRIFVSCRDQIVILHDRNNDGESDFYECFNNDHQVTEHFHEFAMGLQADDYGNLYYAKSARHALPASVPHHGTLLRVSADGAQTDILATGFRAANGVCLNPDGTFVVTDQEGHWNPKNRINWVREGGFYGNMFGWHDVADTSDEAMEPPLCWITNTFDRSPGELLWVDSPSWGPLNGTLLNLSYGYGKVYVVPFEEVNGQAQGGMCAFPIRQFPTGVMRGRFHPHDGHLYVCGLVAWASSQPHQGGLYRLRVTGREALLPISLQTHHDGLTIGFTDTLDRSAAEDIDSWRVRVWSLKRTENYGSDHYDERPLEVSDAVLSADGLSVRLAIPDIAPTWCMEIHCQLQSFDGSPVERVIHNTIHALSSD